MYLGSLGSHFDYAEGYIIFAFPFVRTFVRSCVCHIRGIYLKVFHKVALKFLKWGISHELLIRKHSYLDHGYLGRSASMPWVLAPEFIHASGWGWGSKSRTPLKSVFILFRYGNNLCRWLVRHGSTLWHWPVGHEVKVSMTSVSWFSKFALHLEDYLMYEHHSLG